MTDAKGATAPNSQNISVTDHEAVMLRMYGLLSARDQRVVNATLSALVRETMASRPIVGSADEESGDG